MQLLVLIPFYTLGSNPLDRELVYTNDSSFFSFQIDEPLQAGVGSSAQTFYRLFLETQDSDLTFCLLFANHVFNR